MERVVFEQIGSLLMNGKNGIVEGYLIGILLAGFIGFFASFSIATETAEEQQVAQIQGQAK